MRVEKASSGMERVVAWLQRADPKMKLAACLCIDLLQHESNLQNKGYYDGDVGNDLLKDWSDDVGCLHSEALADDDAYVAGFAIALASMDA